LTVAELVTYRVSEDPASPTPAEGYVVSFAAFYEWGFGVPLHQSLRSLLHHYCLELHNLTPLGILHIAAFVTLCEIYLGIDPHFDLENYFFCFWHSQDPRVELTILGAWLSNPSVGMAFTGKRPLPEPNWEYGVVKKDFSKLLPFREVLQ
jgi:hypothetical protein